MARTYNEAVAYDVQMYDWTPGLNTPVAITTGISATASPATMSAPTMTPTTFTTSTITPGG